MRINETPRHFVMSATEAELVDLRLRYEAAYDAYQGCLQALEESERRRERPSPQLLALEPCALNELNEARRRYRDALIEVAFLPNDTAH